MKGNMVVLLHGSGDTREAALNDLIVKIGVKYG